MRNLVAILALTAFSTALCAAGVAPGLNLGNNEYSPLQLSENGMPGRWTLDPDRTATRLGAVTQWAYSGGDSDNAVEISISTWNERAQGYFNWKHGMLATGQYSLQPINIADNALLGVNEPHSTNQAMFLEKSGADKQILMRVGPYMAEFHYRGKQYSSQAGSPIKPDDMIELAQAYAGHLTQCALAAAAEEASADLYRREIVEASQTPNRFVNDWPDYHVGIINVGECQRAQNFQVIGGNTDLFAIYWKNSARRLVFQRRPSFGATEPWAGLANVVLEPGTYAVSCNTAGNGTGNIVLAYDLISVDFQWESLFSQPQDTGGSTAGSGQSRPKVATVPTFHLDSKIDVFARPDEIENYTTKASLDDLPPDWQPGLDRLNPCGWTIPVGGKIRLWVEGCNGQAIPASFQIISGSSVGRMEGDTFVAVQPGEALVMRVSNMQGFTILKQPDGSEKFINDPRFRSAFKIRVIPADAHFPYRDQPWTTSPDEFISGMVYRVVGGVRQPVAEALVTLDLHGGEVANTRTDQNGHYGFTGTDLGKLPAGTYELRGYGRTESVGTDLWNAQKQTVQLPLQQGQVAAGMDIELITVQQKFGFSVPAP